MRAHVLETIWRRPEGIWVKPEQLAESMGITTAHVNDLTRRGALTRRPSDGAVFVTGSDTPRLLPRSTTAEAATLSDVARMLNEVHCEMQAVHARIDRAVESEVSRVFAATLNAPEPAPKAPHQQSSWFAFPFGISL